MKSKSGTYDSLIKEAFKSLGQDVSKKGILKIEKKRVLLDLYAIHERLEKGEYWKANFSPNKFDIEDRNHQVFTDLEFYCLVGKTWSDIFDAIKVKKASVIADICPGYSPKIELGLYYSGYTKKIVLLEKSASSSRMLLRFIDLIKPPYKLESRTVDISKKSEISYDVVLGNHIMDDIVVDYFAPKFGLKLDELYLKESTMQKFWSTILKERVLNTKKIVDMMTPRFAALVKPRGFIAISHYASYADRLLGLRPAAEFNMGILRVIAGALCREYGFTDKRVILEKALRNKKGHFRAKDCILLQRR